MCKSNITWYRLHEAEIVTMILLIVIIAAIGCVVFMVSSSAKDMELKATITNATVKVIYKYEDDHIVVDSDGNGYIAGNSTIYDSMNVGRNYTITTKQYEFSKMKIITNIMW